PSSIPLRCGFFSFFWVVPPGFFSIFSLSRGGGGPPPPPPRQENCGGQAFRRQAAHATECCNCPRWFLKEEWAAF
ncbi:hypothetical protein DF133_28840, partial [Burkholderia cenocepacia]